jgi:hypothetical protein
VAHALLIERLADLMLALHQRVHPLAEWLELTIANASEADLQHTQSIGCHTPPRPCLLSASLRLDRYTAGCLLPTKQGNVDHRGHNE